MGTQQARVRRILEGARRPLAIHEIGERIRRKFGTYDADTAISARIRDLRRALEREGMTIHSWRAGPGKAHHVYLITRLSQD